MSNIFYTDCRYDNCIFNLLGNVHCLNQMCSVKLCMCKEILQSLSRINHQCAQCTSVCQVRNFVFGEQTISFFLSSKQGIYFLKKKILKKKKQKKNKSNCSCLELSIVPAGIVRENGVPMSIHGKRIVKVAMKVYNAKLANTF